MSIRVPVYALTVDDARALGGITTPQCGLDFLLAPSANQSPWIHSGTEYLPSLKSIAPRGGAAAVDMILSDNVPTYGGNLVPVAWTVQAGVNKWDDKARPATAWRTRYLHFFDGAIGALGRVQTVADFAPNWMAHIYRYVPPTGTVAPGSVSIRMLGNGLGYPSWRIVIPVGNQERKGPYLRYDRYSNGNAVTVSEYAQDGTGSTDTGLQEWIISCELTLNQWIIGVAVNGKTADEPWVFTLPRSDVGNPVVLDAIGNPTPICSPGKIEIQTQGQQIMASLVPIRYPLVSEFYRRDFFPIDTRFGDVTRVTDPLTGVAVIAKPEGTEAEVTIETEASNSIGPRVTMYCQPPQTVRPVCGVVTALLPAALSTAVTDPWTSTGKSNLRGTIHLTRYSAWRGNELRATIADPDGELDWKGNNVVAFAAGLQTVGGSAPTLTKLFTGYLTGPARTAEGVDEMLVEITAQDYVGARLPHKTMAFSRCLGGAAFADAFAEIGNRLGFPSSQIEITGCDDLWLPTPQIIGEPSLAWSDEHNPEEALDTICKVVDRVWGITAAGKLFARPAAAYSGTPAYTLDSDTTTPSEIIPYLSSKREMAEFANNVLASAGPEGYRDFSWVQSLSEADPTDPSFIGDMFWLCESIENAYADAYTMALNTFVKRFRFADVITWRPAVPHPEVYPGTFCKLQVEDMQIATDGIYFVTEERAEFDLADGTELGWQQEFQMVRVEV